MEPFEQKFAAFLEYLKKNVDSNMVWNDKFTTTLKAALVNAKFDQMVGGNVVIHKKKRVNGYNLFMKERMTQLKETDLDSNHRMTQISEEWNKLTPEEKETWKQKAKDAFPPEPAKLQIKLKKERKNTKLSGYQLFVREKMVELKDKVTPRERMSEIGKMWQLQTEEQKTAYGTRAAEIPVVPK